MNGEEVFVGELDGGDAEEEGGEIEEFDGILGGELSCVWGESACGDEDGRWEIGMRYGFEELGDLAFGDMGGGPLFGRYGDGVVTASEGEIVEMRKRWGRESGGEFDGISFAAKEFAEKDIGLVWANGGEGTAWGVFSGGGGSSEPPDERGGGDEEERDGVGSGGIMGGGDWGVGLLGDRGCLGEENQSESKKWWAKVHWRGRSRIATKSGKFF